ncbi:MAG: Segregation and condensation protein A [Parcubacteria group bacterium GW2011_GWA2_47_21]|nr:MAG: Segregation and condensation protein A [Parcubacteria group bacterium GW2011_GWA2_47_21]
MSYTFPMSFPMSFEVKTGVFQGPLDLLLNLIEKRKLHINEISLAKVADDFILYTKRLGDFPLSESANFILIAATLVLIKSRSLLPNLELSEEEGGSIEELERRLKLYKRMRGLARHISKNLGLSPIYNPCERPIEPVFSPDSAITPSNLLGSIREVLKNLPKKDFLPKAIVDKVISLEEMIENLTERIKTSIKMSFREFSKIGREKKVNVIVGFLAMLELVKQGIIQVKQEKHFEDITIETESVATPNYA